MIRFGTDGVRARYGDWPLTDQGAHVIGQAVAALVGPGASVIIGRDTRQSGPALRDALARGLQAGGAHVLDGGVMPTAAVSCAVADSPAAAGVVITASHNPWWDNGIKVLDDTGRKLTELDRLQALFEGAPAPGGGTLAPLANPLSAWRSAMPSVDLQGARILLDCAHGAAAQPGPALFRERGAQLVLWGASPDGRNINDGVGALHPPTAQQVAETGCDLAICLDGDADRVLLVSPTLGLLDGDDLLWLLQPQGPVIGTVMSNGGLEAALGGRLVRTPVGDRHVAEALTRTGAQVGAEPSGHVLFSDGLPTGDGIYSALRVLQATPVEGIERAAQGWERWPTAQANLPVQGPRQDLDALQAVRGARAAGDRVVIRYSGTEPLVRILVEGLDEPDSWVRRISDELQGASDR